MSATDKTPDATRAKLSTLWIVVLFNIAFADLVGFVHPGALERIIAGEVGFELTQGLLLGFSVFLEIPIAMIFLSRVLNAAANRWANTVAGTLSILFVIGGGSATLSYIFFATAEVLCIALIIWYAWALPREVARTGRPSLKSLGERP